MYEIEGAPVTREDERLFGRYQRPLPEYALMVEYSPMAERVKVSPEERRRRVEELKGKVRDGVLKIQQSEEFRNYLLAMSRFHEYSWHNQLLIWMQRPDATLVRGFQGWKELGRYVRKGETGIRILAPAGPTTETTWVSEPQRRRWYLRRDGKKWTVVDVDTGRVDKEFPTYGTAKQWLLDQGAVPHKEVVQVTRFVDVAVFDIKQTEGKPLPEFVVPTLTGKMHGELYDSVLALMAQRGVQVTFEPRPHLSPEIKGMFQHPDRIWVKPDEPGAQQLKTLLHEAAHYYSLGPFGMPRADAETIAESAAFVVGAHHGFDTGVRSFPYVALWARDEETLRKNLEAIQKVSEHMVEQLEEVEPVPAPIPREPPIEPAPPRPEPEPAPRLTLEQMETTYSLEKVKQMARDRGISTAGSKREIIRRLL